VTIISNLAHHFTTTFIFCTFVKFTREKNTKTKSKNLILELFILIFDFSCNKRVSQSFFFSASKLDHSYKIPSGQLYHNTKHLNYEHACTQRIDLIKVNSLIFCAE